MGGGGGSSISGCEGRWGKAVGKHIGEMCLRGQVWKHVYEREAKLGPYEGLASEG